MIAIQGPVPSGPVHLDMFDIPRCFPIYVVGHANPDTDTVCSSILLSELLSELGFDAHPLLTGPLNPETAFVMDLFGILPPDTAEDLSGLHLAIVDHNVPEHGMQGELEADVVLMVDHHLLTGGSYVPRDSVVDLLGSTATVIYGLYRALDIPVDRRTARMIVAAMVSDTFNLKAPTTTPSDVEAMSELLPIAEIDLDYVFTRMMDMRSDISGLDGRAIVDSELKYYEAATCRFFVSTKVVMTDGQSDAVGRMVQSHLSEHLSDYGVGIAFFLMHRMHENRTEVLCFGDGSTDIFHEAFGHGQSSIFDRIISRKIDFVPVILDAMDVGRG